MVGEIHQQCRRALSATDVNENVEGARLRVATYNVHGCVGIDGRRSETRIAKVIAALQVDVIGLHELDVNRRRSARKDQAAIIAEQLGWTRFFHPAMSKAEEDYGDAILSRFPMNLRQAALLPASAPFYCREPRAALWVEVMTPLGRVHIINTHFGLGRRERQSQAQLLIGPEWLGRVPVDDPLVILGDFNSSPTSLPYRTLTTKLRDARSFFHPSPPLRTYSTRWPLLAVDHIFLCSKLRAETIEVARSPQGREASDHYAVVAEISRRVA
jgi:endonuclease/exonuclease/phosphatase family metal-dependent hydrolase